MATSDVPGDGTHGGGRRDGAGNLLAAGPSASPGRRASRTRLIESLKAYFSLRKSMRR